MITGMSQDLGLWSNPGPCVFKASTLLSNHPTSVGQAEPREMHYGDLIMLGIVGHPSIARTQAIFLNTLCNNTGAGTIMREVENPRTDSILC